MIFNIPVWLCIYIACLMYFGTLGAVTVTCDFPSGRRLVMQGWYR